MHERTRVTSGANGCRRGAESGKTVQFPRRLIFTMEPVWRLHGARQNTCEKAIRPKNFVFVSSSSKTAKTQIEQDAFSRLSVEL